MITYRNYTPVAYWDEKLAPVPGWGMRAKFLAGSPRIAIGAFGDVTNVSTASGTAHADPTAVMCSPDGNTQAAQQMLSDLGYYVGPIDGTMSPATLSAVASFSSASNLSPLAAVLDPSNPTVPFCTALINAWNKKKSDQFSGIALMVVGVLGLAVSVWGVMASKKAKPNRRRRARPNIRHRYPKKATHGLRVGQLVYMPGTNRGYGRVLNFSEDRTPQGYRYAMVQWDTHNSWVNTKELDPG